MIEDTAGLLSPSLRMLLFTPESFPLTVSVSSLLSENITHLSTQAPQRGRKRERETHSEGQAWKIKRKREEQELF